MKVSNNPPDAAFVFSHPLHWLAFGGGAGLSPAAPGTAGTLVAVPLCWLMQGLPVAWYVAVTALLFLAGIGICAVTVRRIGVHDHPGVVWDEIVGYLLAMTFAPPGWFWLAAGFVLFRIFDIWKPWPINQLDRRIHGGFGVMVDDAIAALYAGAILYAAALAVG